jgi:CelD/BcsL family acetyltransferase involved in cellulose biosynthesis
MLVEHNELLARNGETEVVIAELFRAIDGLEDWEELKVAFGERESWAPEQTTRNGMTSIVDWAHPTWVAPLTAQTSVESLLAGLSTNRRYQLRRAMKEFEKRGPLSILAAKDAGEALNFFRALGELHTRRWRIRGKEGCFSRVDWVRFHEILIQNGFANGAVQLLRIRCGDEDIGYIYNLLWRGKVLMLQTGFLHTTNNMLRSGYVSHLLAMELNARLGMTGYDFMPGNDEYKRVLAQPGASVALIRFQRRRVKFRIEGAAVAVVRRLRGWSDRLRRVKSYIEAVACLMVLLPDRACEWISQTEMFASILPLQ